jgi:hypothetical protein
MRRIVRYARIALLSAVVTLMTALAMLAIYYSNLPGEYLRLGLAGLRSVQEGTDEEATCEAAHR